MTQTLLIGHDPSYMDYTYPTTITVSDKHIMEGGGRGEQSLLRGWNKEMEDGILNRKSWVIFSKPY